MTIIRMYSQEISKLIDKTTASVQETMNSRDAIDVLNRAASLLWFQDLERAAASAKRAYEKASRLSDAVEPLYWKGIADALVNWAHIDVRRLQMEQVRARLMDALSMYYHLKDKQGEAWVYYVLSLSEAALSNPLNALHMVENGLKACESGLVRGRLLNSRGLIYIDMHNYPAALIALNEAVTYLDIPENLRGLSDVYDNLARVQLAQGNYEQALTMAQSALSIARQNLDVYGIIEISATVGDAYLSLGDRFRANEHYESGLSLAREIRYVDMQANLLLSIARARRQAQHHQAAILFLHEMLHFAEKHERYQAVVDAHEMLAQVFAEMGNYEKAYEHQRLYHEVFTNLMHARTTSNYENQLAHQRLEITEREAKFYQSRNEQLNERVRQLNLVLQVSDEMSSSLNIHQVMLLALDACMRLSGSTAGFIARRVGDVYEITKAMGLYIETLHPIQIQLPVLQQLQEVRTPLVVPVRPEDGLAKVSDSQVRLILPLFVRDELRGFINLESKQARQFEPNRVQLLKLMGSYITTALENARLYDQTQRQLAEMQTLYEQVSQLEHLKSDMIRIAAHDLKGPLNVIGAYLQIWDSERQNLSHRQAEQVERMSASVRQMNALISDILSLERIERMAEGKSLEPTNLLDIVEVVLDQFQRRIRDHEHQLTWQHGTLNKALVLGDSAQLHEAIANLLSNAIKYTPQGGKIEVKLTREEGNYSLTIQDNGYGISEAGQARLFHPFYRVRTDKTQYIEGTGLGLHLVKNIVTRHNGTMVFQSVEGEGSTFGFRLPCALL